MLQFSLACFVSGCKSSLIIKFHFNITLTFNENRRRSCRPYKGSKFPHIRNETFLNLIRHKYEIITLTKADFYVQSLKEFGCTVKDNCLTTFGKINVGLHFLT